MQNFVVSCEYVHLITVDINMVIFSFFNLSIIKGI